MSRRTTITLEDDVADLLHEESRRTGKPFKDVVNRAIRDGLDARSGRRIEPFVVKARPMRAKPGIDFDDVEGLLDRVEGPYRR